jgi:hypothetical protein
MFTVHCQENDCGWSVFNQTEEGAYGRASIHSRESGHSHYQIVYHGEFTLAVLDNPGFNLGITP